LSLDRSALAFAKAPFRFVAKKPAFAILRFNRCSRGDGALQGKVVESATADTCLHCGDVLKQPKPRFSLVDLIHKISVPLVLLRGNAYTILSYFSMEGERQMEQTRKLLADAFDKDPVNSNIAFSMSTICWPRAHFTEMTVSVLDRGS
jgi:hypothetical protein